MKKNNILFLGFAVRLLLTGSLYAQTGSNSNPSINGMDSLKQTHETMKIEIWSDVVCPFCYIGKTRLEEALAQFSNGNSIEIEWKSYQLMPGIVTNPDKSIDEILSETKGVSLSDAKQMNEQAALMGKHAGLEYNFDRAIVANTFRAHQFIHFAKQYGKQGEAETHLFSAYFTEGKNVDDIPTLVEIAQSIGLDTVALKTALKNESFANAVTADIQEAQQLGVRGVPFFVFDRKYAVSGAQDTQVFMEVLEKAYVEWKMNHPQKQLEIQNGAVCSPDQQCK